MYKKWEGDAVEAVATCTANGEQKENLVLGGVQSCSSPPVSYSFKNVFPNLVILIT